MPSVASYEGKPPGKAGSPPARKRSPVSDKQPAPRVEPLPEEEKVREAPSVSAESPPASESLPASEFPGKADNAPSSSAYTRRQMAAACLASGAGVGFLLWLGSQLSF